MTLKELASHQKTDRFHALSVLIDRCARRFRSAGDLVDIGGTVFEKIRESARERNFDTSALEQTWEVICARYRRDRFDAHPDLFNDHDVESLQRWREFIYREFFPTLLAEQRMCPECSPRQRIASVPAKHVRRRIQRQYFVTSIGCSRAIPSSCRDGPASWPPPVGRHGCRMKCRHSCCEISRGRSTKPGL